jgi:nucleoside-diphosphate-sugar epimerase
MKVLITGAAGFIGYRTALRLKESGLEVVCLVRKTSKTEGLERAGIRLVIGDITDLKGIDSVFASEKPRHVVHSAARVFDEKDMFRVNVAGTRNICEVSLKYGVEKLVYLSSVAVISGNKLAPLVEGLPYSSENVYGRSKIEAERIVIEYRKRGLKSAVLRPCMVYGEGEPHALGRILGLVKKRLIPVSGIADLKEKLQLVYVGNVVYAIELALAKDEALDGTFIIADKEVITIRKFLNIVSDELGVKRPYVIPAWLMSLILLVPFFRKKHYRLYKDRVYDISRAEQLLGYDPPVSTEEALRRTVRYWKKLQADS